MSRTTRSLRAQVRRLERRADCMGAAGLPPFGSMNTYTLTIDNWHPARLNLWDGRHWKVRARHKRADREIVGLYARLAGIPPATGKRRVSLRLTLGPRQRGADPDAYFKSVLDALVHAGLLVDDDRHGVELGDVVFQRGKIKGTEIVLEDVA
jgi:hypothetical protein